ncbi:hypothetical protein [Rhodoferax sp. U11-2br]|uniref:hypothetical protein n=1 Tax=Rhodoferax sp. U11-2br TaxID=2838878 RepID=UPI001BEBCC6C|nr:hypothetical protein [Rhodoferax sp. U11-2br]MBT3067276.1 hypothetical protein [Rhodoferax sp. U11-2br]
MQLSRFAPLCVAAAWAASTLGSPAWAHDEATLDAMVSAHGGQLRMAGIYHFELVVAPVAMAGQGVTVQVYVTDHLGQNINTTQASGSVSFVSGTHRTQVSLSPQGDNALAGSLAQRPKPGTQAVVSIAPVPGQAPLQARFTRLQAKPIPAGHKPTNHAEMPKDAAHQH